MTGTDLCVNKPHLSRSYLNMMDFRIEIINYKTCRSQWPSGLGRVFTAVRLLGLRVRIPPGALMVVRCECCVRCRVEVSATGLSLVQRSPTDCGASLFMISEPL